jgi:hypothetical protein
MVETNSHCQQNACFLRRSSWHSYSYFVPYFIDCTRHSSFTELCFRAGTCRIVRKAYMKYWFPSSKWQRPIFSINCTDFTLTLLSEGQAEPLNKIQLFLNFPINGPSSSTLLLLFLFPSTIVFPLKEPQSDIRCHILSVGFLIPAICRLP